MKKSLEKSTRSSTSSANALALVAVVSASSLANGTPSSTISHVVGGSLAESAEAALAFTVIGQERLLKGISASLTSLGVALETRDCRSGVKVRRVVESLARGSQSHDKKSNSLKLNVNYLATSWQGEGLLTNFILRIFSKEMIPSSLT